MDRSKYSREKNYYKNKKHKYDSRYKSRERSRERFKDKSKDKYKRRSYSKKKYTYTRQISERGKYKYDRHYNKDSSSSHKRIKKKSYSRDKKYKTRDNYSNNKTFKRSRSNHDFKFISNKRKKSLTISVESKKSSSSSDSGSKIKKGDEGHYNYKIGNFINEDYQIKTFLGDGTFGRVIECERLSDGKLYAVKIIRPVERYLESAKIEAEIIMNIQKHDKKYESHCVRLIEYFDFMEEGKKYMALIFEKLGLSLYEFIKSNKYRGFDIDVIKCIARQILQGIGYLHDRLELTHTDLKPENILFKNNEIGIMTDKKFFPKNILEKEKRERSTSPSTRSLSKEKEDIYKFPLDSEIRIIDFGGATYKHERHSDIINTRQYRAPEVILGSCKWNEKSDVWSVACILIELYTGELFFPTHDNVEHLCLIEKACGPIPGWMLNGRRREFNKIFSHLNFSNDINKDVNKVSLESITNRAEIEQAVRLLETVDDLVLEEHHNFKSLLKSMLLIDPTLRPSCNKCLRHEFFNS